MVSKMKESLLQVPFRKMSENKDDKLLINDVFKDENFEA